MNNTHNPGSPGPAPNSSPHLRLAIVSRRTTDEVFANLALALSELSSLASRIRAANPQEIDEVYAMVLARRSRPDLDELLAGAAASSQAEAERDDGDPGGDSLDAA